MNGILTCAVVVTVIAMSQLRKEEVALAWWTRCQTGDACEVLLKNVSPRGVLITDLHLTLAPLNIYHAQLDLPFVLAPADTVILGVGFSEVVPVDAESIRQHQLRRYGTCECPKTDHYSPVLERFLSVIIGGPMLPLPDALSVNCNFWYNCYDRKYGYTDAEATACEAERIKRYNECEIRRKEVAAPHWATERARLDAWPTRAEAELERQKVIHKLSFAIRAALVLRVNGMLVPRCSGVECQDP
jgi:hypothetical protein